MLKYVKSITVNMNQYVNIQLDISKSQQYQIAPLTFYNAHTVLKLRAFFAKSDVFGKD